MKKRRHDIYFECNYVIQVVKPEVMLSRLFEYLDVLKIASPFSLSILVCKNNAAVIAVHVKNLKISIGKRL